MTTDTKKLAKFAAEFLDDDFNDISCLFGMPQPPVAPDTFFLGSITAPYFAHLAKREMEKRGFRWISIYSHDPTNKANDYYYEFTRVQDEYGECFNKNEFISLWSAIEATGEK